MALWNQDFSLFLQDVFLLSLENVVNIMYIMPLWERINLGLECIGITLIGFKLLFSPFLSVFIVSGKKWVCVAISYISIC